MPIRDKQIIGGNGIPITKEVDGSADHALVPNSTYFRDLSDGSIYFKNALGDVLSLFTESLTDVDNGPVIYVSPVGNDLSGTIGNPLKPFATLDAAYAAALSYRVRQYTVTTAAVSTSININDGVHVPATYTANFGTTKAADAAGLVAVINADGVNLLASQDNPGVDEYFYVTATTDTPYVVSLLGNLKETIKLNIHVLPGNYTVTTTASNGLAISGVNWICEPGAVITKTSAGPLFDTALFVNPFILTGQADFVTGGACTFLVGPITHPVDVHFECHDITQTFGSVFGISSNNKKFNCKVNNITSSTGYIWYGNAGAGSGTINVEFVDVAGPSVWFGGINTTVNIKGNSVVSTTATAFENMYLSKYNIDITNCTATAGGTFSYNIPSSIHNYINIRGTADKMQVLDGTVVFNGTLTSLTMTGGRVKCCVIRNGVTISGGELEYTSGADDNSNLAMSGGRVIMNMSYHGYGPSFTCSGGTLMLRGIADSFFTLANRTISGGKVICDADITYGASDYLGNREIFNLTSGTLVLRNCTLYNNNSLNNPLAYCVLYSGGTLICNGAVLKTNTTTTPTIQVNGSDRNVKVLAGGLSSNRPEAGGLFAPKSHQIRFAIDSVAITTITLDGTTFTSTVLTNTADIAAELLGLINADIIPITASQDNPGIDNYLYVTHDTPSTLIVHSDTNATSTTIRMPSYALINTTTGLVIESTLVE